LVPRERRTTWQRRAVPLDAGRFNPRTDERVPAGREFLTPDRAELELRWRTLARRRDRTCGIWLVARAAGVSYTATEATLFASAPVSLRDQRAVWAAWLRLLRERRSRCDIAAIPIARVPSPHDVNVERAVIACAVDVMEAQWWQARYATLPTREARAGRVAWNAVISQIGGGWTKIAA